RRVERSDRPGLPVPSSDEEGAAFLRASPEPGLDRLPVRADDRALRRDLQQEPCQVVRRGGRLELPALLHLQSQALGTRLHGLAAAAEAAGQDALRREGRQHLGQLERLTAAALVQRPNAIVPGPTLPRT